MTLVEIGVLITTLSTVTAVALSLYRWNRERKANTRADRDEDYKGPAERDAIIIQGAERAVIILEKALNVAYVEREAYAKDRDLERSRAEEFRVKVYQLEQALHTKDRQVTELQQRVAELEALRDGKE